MHTHVYTQSGIITLDKQSSELLQSCNNGVASNWNFKGLSEVLEPGSGGEERQTLDLFKSEGRKI